MPREGYKPKHCPTCQCEPVGQLPPGVPVDPYCPEHGDRPTAYDDCSCFRRAARAGATAERLVADGWKS